MRWGYPGRRLRNQYTIVYDLFMTNCTTIVCSDVQTVSSACIDEWSCLSVYDTENYDRNTESGIT